MSKPSVYELTNIRYTKLVKEGSEYVPGEVTYRTVIPTFVPSNNMKALDVTSLNEADRARMLSLIKDYAEYYKQATSTIFSFEDWLSHTGNDGVSPQWRTFIIDQVNVLDQE